MMMMPEACPAAVFLSIESEMLSNLPENVPFYRLQSVDAGNIANSIGETLFDRPAEIEKSSYSNHYGNYEFEDYDWHDYSSLDGKYDQLILAGASLGVVHKREWQITFLDQLGFAIKEHGVKEVMILDHRDCGAYKKLLVPGVGPEDPKKEKKEHTRICKQAIGLITKKFKEIEEVHCLLLPVETVEKLASWP